MDLLTSVLASPRGRFFCANIAYRISTADSDPNYYRPRTVTDARDVIGGVDISTVSALTEAELFGALGYAADFARYWQPPDEDDVIFADPGVISALRPIAEAVLATERAAWWGDPIDVANQRLVLHRVATVEWPESTAPYQPPEAGLAGWRSDAVDKELRFSEYRLTHPHQDVHGEWWSTPIFATLSTTRARPGIGALELVMQEDSSGEGDARVWPVHLRGAPRVYEVSTPADWARLVEKYPFAVSDSRRGVWFETTGEYRDWFIPDWAAVAEDYDAAHLSLHGYLTTPGVAISLSNNEGATLLGGWDPDATFWLNPDMLDVEPEPELWRREDQRWISM